MVTYDITHALIASRGTVLIGEVGATPPTVAELKAFAADLSDLPTGLNPIGFTHPEELPGFDSEGGDKTMKHTWEMENAREIQTSARTNFYTVNPLQADNELMKIWEGGGDNSLPEQFWAPMSPVTVERSATVVLIDAGEVVGYHNPKVAISKAGGFQLSRDDWAKFPLRFTELSHAAAKGPHAWIGENFGTAPTTPLIATP